MREIKQMFGTRLKLKINTGSMKDGIAALSRRYDFIWFDRYGRSFVAEIGDEFLPFMVKADGQIFEVDVVNSRVNAMREVDSF